MLNRFLLGAENLYGLLEYIVKKRVDMFSRFYKSCGITFWSRKKVINNYEVCYHLHDYRDGRVYKELINNFGGCASCAALSELDSYAKLQRRLYRQASLRAQFVQDAGRLDANV